jgi:hypothetical protein
MNDFSDYPKDNPNHFIVPSDEPYTDMDWPQVVKNYHDANFITFHRIENFRHNLNMKH